MLRVLVCLSVQIVDFPVVYCSDEFSRMMGYPRCDIMQSPAAGDFMSGALTDAVTVGMLTELRVSYSYRVAHLLANLVRVHLDLECSNVVLGSTYLQQQPASPGTPQI